MIKAFLKLLVAVLIANALWRVGSSYLAYYKFSDEVSELALHDAEKTDSELKERVLELATTYGEPVQAEDIDVTRDAQHLVIQANYSKPVAVVPGYEYQWPFSVKADRPFVNNPLPVH
jgi:hypothetical protein